MKIMRLLALLLVSLSLCACGHLVGGPLVENQSPQGVTYYLPIPHFVAMATEEDGAVKKDYQLRLMPNLRYPYQVSLYPGLFSADIFDISLSRDGMLTSVSGYTSDKSVESLRPLASLGITAAAPLIASNTSSTSNSPVSVAEQDGRHQTKEILLAANSNTPILLAIAKNNEQPSTPTDTAQNQIDYIALIRSTLASDSPNKVVISGAFTSQITALNNIETKANADYNYLKDVNKSSKTCESISSEIRKILGSQQNRSKSLSKIQNDTKALRSDIIYSICTDLNNSLGYFDITTSYYRLEIALAKAAIAVKELNKATQQFFLELTPSEVDSYYRGQCKTSGIFECLQFNSYGACQKNPPESEPLDNIFRNALVDDTRLPQNPKPNDHGRKITVKWEINKLIAITNVFIDSLSAGKAKVHKSANELKLGNPTVTALHELELRARLFLNPNGLPIEMQSDSRQWPKFLNAMVNTEGEHKRELMAYYYALYIRDLLHSPADLMAKTNTAHLLTRANYFEDRMKIKAGYQLILRINALQAFLSKPIDEGSGRTRLDMTTELASVKEQFVSEVFTPPIPPKTQPSRSSLRVFWLEPNATELPWDTNDPLSRDQTFVLIKPMLIKNSASGADKRGVK